MTDVDREIVELRKQMYYVDAIAELTGIDIEYVRWRLNVLGML